MTGATEFVATKRPPPPSINMEAPVITNVKRIGAPLRNIVNTRPVST